MRIAGLLLFSAAALSAGAGLASADELDEKLDNFFERLFSDDDDEGFDDDDPEFAGGGRVVNVCDAFGTGFYYIPGTEECLTIAGSVRLDWIESPSVLGAGTVRTGPIGGPEGRLYTLPGNVLRSGLGAQVEYGLGGGKFVYAGADYSAGRANASGTAQNGTNDTTLIALTFGRPDNVFGTGVFTGTAGFGVSGSGSIDNRWAIGEVGFGRSFDFEGACDPALIFRGGLYVEGLNYNASGRTDVTFNGAPLAGFYQTFDMTTRDTFAGIKARVEYDFSHAERLRFSVGAEVSVAHHSASARFRQTTGVGGGATVTDALDYDRSEVVVGGGLSAGAEYAVAKDWTLGVSYEYSILPNVTKVTMRENPSTPELSVSDESIDRHFFQLKVRRTF